jgi:hypothetical protein
MMMMARGQLLRPYYLCGVYLLVTVISSVTVSPSKKKNRVTALPIPGTPDFDAQPAFSSRYVVCTAQHSFC